MMFGFSLRSVASFPLHHTAKRFKQYKQIIPIGPIDFNLCVTTPTAFRILGPSCTTIRKIQLLTGVHMKVGTRDHLANIGGEYNSFRVCLIQGTRDAILNVRVI